MIPSLFNTPQDDRQWSSWSWSHFNAHRRIILALQAKGKNLTLFDLEPINFGDLPNWLNRNQQSHNDFNSAIGLNSSDLITVDFKNENQLRSWIYVHAKEHQAAAEKLGIG